MNAPQKQPSSPHRLPEIPGGWKTDQITIRQHTFRLTLPAKPDAFLDDPDVLAAHQRNGYMPYWTYLWPAAISTAKAVMSIDWPKQTDALELGAGIGLVGLAALARGLNVTFSDHDTTAVALAIHNAQQNGFTNCTGLVMDWIKPAEHRFPVILACDILYEKKDHASVLNAIDTMLTKNGTCYIGDPGRAHTEDFMQRIKNSTFTINLINEHNQEQTEFKRAQFQILKIRRS